MSLVDSCLITNQTISLIFISKRYFMPIIIFVKDIISFFFYLNINKISKSIIFCFDVFLKCNTSVGKTIYVTQNFIYYYLMLFVYIKQIQSRNFYFLSTKLWTTVNKCTPLGAAGYDCRDQTLNNWGKYGTLYIITVMSSETSK